MVLNPHPRLQPKTELIEEKNHESADQPKLNQLLGRSLIMKDKQSVKCLRGHDSRM
jgi:hypothetical protein